MDDTTRAGRNLPEVDHVTASVVQGALENIAVEMGYKLMRMSYSSIIRESEDFGAALVDGEGRGLAESAQSTPLQSGPIPGYVKGIMRILEARGEAVRPGDVIMHNDAYAGASHGPDIAFAVPVFDNCELLGFAVTTAHHLDVGALTPGAAASSMRSTPTPRACSSRRSRSMTGARRSPPVWHILRDNIRVSDLVVGDMEAQIAAARFGAGQMLELVGRHGRATFRAACESVMNYSERRMRRAIAAAARPAPIRPPPASTAISTIPIPRGGELPLVVNLTSTATTWWSISPAPPTRSPTGPSTCRSRERSISPCGSPCARCCSTPRPMATFPSTRGWCGRSASSRPRAASPIPSSRRRPSPASRRATSSPTR